MSHLSKSLHDDRNTHILGGFGKGCGLSALGSRALQTAVAVSESQEQAASEPSARGTASGCAVVVRDPVVRGLSGQSRAGVSPGRPEHRETCGRGCFLSLIPPATSVRAAETRSERDAGAAARFCLRDRTFVSGAAETAGDGTAPRGEIPDDVTRVVVDPSVKIISRAAFEDHPALAEVVLPEGLVEIKARAFRRCTSLKNISLPSTLEEIDLHAFTKTAIEKILLPAALVKYKYAFVLCQKLTEVVFAEGCRVVDEDAFDNCHGLEHVHFSSTIENIGENAFASCWSLTGVTLPDSVLTIGSDCWQQCNLKKFRVPPLVTSFDATTMRGNGGILSLELHGNIECISTAENNRLATLSIRNIAIPPRCSV
ncbi:hypothetical protein THAOC_17362, partial [Thalassiosira oceanica]